MRMSWAGHLAKRAGMLLLWTAGALLSTATCTASQVASWMPSAWVWQHSDQQNPGIGSTQWAGGSCIVKQAGVRAVLPPAAR